MPVSYVSDYTALTDGQNRWNNAGSVGTPMVITYSFPDQAELPSFDALPPVEPASTNIYKPMDSARQTAVAGALEEYASVAGVQFIEVDDPALADLRFVGNDSTGDFSWAYYPSSRAGYSGTSHVVISEELGNLSDDNWLPGRWAFTLLLHEIGHAMGLEHPFSGTVLDPSLDNHNHTVMSYDWTWDDASWPQYSRYTLAELDVDAVQYLYGANTLGALGWTAQWDETRDQLTISATGSAETIIGTKADTAIRAGGGDDTLFGQAGNDTLDGGDGADSMVGADGDDVYFVNQASDTVVESARGGNDTIRSAISLALSTAAPNVENLVLIGRQDIDGIGTDGANRLIGNDSDNLIQGLGGDDTIAGNAGADTLDGGAGTDLLDYSADATGVTVRLWQTSGTRGDAEGDQFSGFEGVTGGSGDDVLNGATVGSILLGNAGNDFLFGLNDADTIDGGAGDDTVIGGNGPDILSGGSGFDVLSYFNDRAGVAVRLWSGGAIGGEASGDVFSDFEAVVGGAGDDTLNGDTDANLLGGNAGADFLFALAGDDTVYGGAGNDTVYGGQGADQLHGGSGFGLLNYATDTAGVAVRLWQGSANGGEAEGDLFSGFEAVSGGSGDDTLNGNGSDSLLYGNGGDDFLFALWGDDTVFGGAGDDTIYGGGGADRLDGGAGFDVLNYATDTSGVAVRLWANSASGGDATGDVISGFEGVTGGGGDDTINGDGYANALYGKSGDDFLFALGGDDTVNGGAGDDTLHGGYGQDRLTGGADADTFVFETSGGEDTISDFETGLDRLLFSSILTDGQYDEAAVLADYASVSNGAVLFDFGGGNTLWLTDVTSTYGLESDMLIV